MPNAVRFEGAVAYMAICRRRGPAAEVLLDAEDARRVQALGLTWHISDRGYVAVQMEGHTVQLHRYICDAPAGTLVDHINCDRLDNRRTNLRVATKFQNQWNRGKASHNSSGYKGVSLHRKSGLWRARIGVEGRRIPLGYFTTPELAAAAYDAAAAQFHGEFAHPNAEPSA